MQKLGDFGGVIAELLECLRFGEESGSMILGDGKKGSSAIFFALFFAILARFPELVSKPPLEGTACTLLATRHWFEPQHLWKYS